MKRIAIVAVVAVGLAGLAVLAVPLVVSPGMVKQRIADRIAGVTGRAVTITGQPSLSIYPHLAVSVGGVTIANPKGMGDDPFVAANEVTTRIRLLPLLTGHIEFDGFELNEPRIHLVVDSNGRTNWRMRRRDRLTGQPAVADLAVGKVDIANGTVVYDDLATKRHEEVTALNLDLSWPTATEAASANGKLRWRDQAVEFNGSVAQPLDLVAGKGSVVHFGIASTPLRVSFNGKMLGSGDYDLEGEASVTTPSLRQVVEWLGTPMGNGSILGPASIEGTMSWLGRTVSFSKAAVGLDGNEAQGAVSIDYSGARPAVRGTFAASKLDLSPYVEAMRADMSADGPWPFAATRLPVVDLFDCDLRISASEVLVGAVRLDRVAATATIKDGAATANIGEAHFYGGTLQARLVATMLGDKLIGSVKGSLSGVSAQSPLNDLLAVSALTGTAAASFDVGGRGATWGEFVHSTTGSVTVDVTDGSVSGVDIGEVATRMVDPLAEPMPAGSGSADFDKLAGTLAIENNTLSTKDLTVEGNTYSVVLTGRGSLLTGTVEATARLAMNADKGTTIPLAITGTWRAPMIGPDQLTLQRDQQGGQPRG